MKNKKKWASILTIATSLVLCIISTFGITLAFFGGNASANLSTITLKTGIEIGAAIESSVGSAKVVPGQPVKIEATGTIEVTDKGTPTEANAVDGVVRAKLTVGDELGDVEISGESDYWTAGGDGYYYLVTEDEGTTLRVVKVGDSVKLFGNLTVSKNFTNADSGKSVEASVIFEVIQAGVYDSVNGGLVDMTVANATSASSPLYASFNAVKYIEEYNIELWVNPNWNSGGYPGEIYFYVDDVEYFSHPSTTPLKLKGTSSVVFGSSAYSYRVYDKEGGTLLYNSWTEEGTNTFNLTGDVSFYIEWE